MRRLPQLTEGHALKFAYDKSNRRVDPSGFLHVADCALTIAGVNDYLGSELQQASDVDLGLDPGTLYPVLRPPEELEKALASYNGVPILIRHTPDSAFDPQKALRIGAVGTSAEWKPPHIRNAITFHDATAIELIESEAQRELSAGYMFRLVIEAGEYEGKPYRFKMADLVCNHVALVTVGRAGPSVTVADSRPSLVKGVSMKLNKSVAAMLASLPGWGKFAQDEGIEVVEDAPAVPTAPAAPAAGGSEVAELVSAIKALLAKVEVEADAAPAPSPAAEAKPAMDEATIVAKIRAEFADKHTATQAVRALVGDVAPEKFGTASEVYAFALNHCGMDAAAHDPSAYAGMVAAIVQSRRPAPVVLADAAPSGVLAGMDLDRFNKGA